MKKHRLIAIVCSLFVITIFIAGLSKMVFYFNPLLASLDENKLNYLPLEKQKEHLEWLPDDPNIVGEINRYIREEIEDSYLNALNILNLSIENKRDLGIPDHFTTPKENYIKNFLEKPEVIKRTNLRHQLKLHFISLDKQLISFTDKGQIQKTIIYDANKTITQLDTLDVKVVMTLNDGKWKINKYRSVL